VRAASGFTASVRAAPGFAAPAFAGRLVPANDPLSAICADLALRDLNLIDSLLSSLEDMEGREEDSDRLAELYNLDHLAARLRRNAENLRVLAGRDADEAPSDASSLVDVIRAAMSSIDRYSMVTIGRVAPLGVVGLAADDVSRLVAELLDNATKSSPPNLPVRVGVHLTEQGSALLRVEDDGIGLAPDRMTQVNHKLAMDPVLDDDAVRHMGLAVVGRLAHRHRMRAWLDRRAPHGTTASVLIPPAVLCEMPESSWSGTNTVAFPRRGRGLSGGTEPRGRRADAPAGDGTGPATPATPAKPATSAKPATPAAPAEPAAPEPPRFDPVARSTTGDTTESGLPRRVSRSLKNPAVEPAGTAGATAAPERAANGPADHDKLLADLSAFSEGEQAARGERRED
jgi:hypothetical protein